jgi:hypothetical protein
VGLLHGRDGLRLDLPQPRGHRVQRPEQLRHRRADGVDVLAQPVGVERERRAARVQPERAQRVALGPRHLRARAPVPAGVAAEGPGPPALGSGWRQFGAAARVAAPHHGVDHAGTVPAPAVTGIETNNRSLGC